MNSQWIDIEDLYEDNNLKENQLCLGMKIDGSIWLYKFMWWDDANGGFYPMVNQNKSYWLYEEGIIKIMPLEKILN